MAKIEKLVKLAKEHLDKDEEVVQVVLGQHEIKMLGKDSIRTGIFLATDKRLVFYAKKITGYDLEVFPYSRISSIEMGKNIMGHSITFFASGNKVRMKWIKEKDKGEVKRFADFVKENMDEKSTKDSRTTLISNPIKQIEELAELKKQGILSQKEFESKKKELLSKL